MDRKKVIIFGATSIILINLARNFNTNFNCDFYLVGRDKKTLNMISQDLRNQNPKTTVKQILHNFLENNISNIKLPKIRFDYCIIGHGVMMNQAKSSLTNLQEMIAINIKSYSEIVYRFYNIFKKNNYGHIVLFGSVAGDRARSKNFWYGSTKSYIHFIGQGILHDISIKRLNIKLSIVKPGPTLTNMTSHLENHFKLADPKEVSRIIFKGIITNKEYIYSLKSWRYLMLIIQLIPRFIFNKIDI